MQNALASSPTLPISMIIPTYCEEKLLPVLLQSIRDQLFQPCEVIVSDAFSTDKTREIAKSFGAVVVDGGKIAVGRNNGAKVAKSDWLLFMDADTILTSRTTLVDAYLEVIKCKIDIASAKYHVVKSENLFAKTIGRFVWSIKNTVAFIQNGTQKAIIEGGAFIFVSRLTFDRTGGFNEKVAITEDILFFQEAIRLGARYRSLNVQVRTSSRRFDTPKKFIKSAGFVLAQIAMIGFGIYIGAKIQQRSANKYGPLGGGAGKLPID